MYYVMVIHRLNRSQHLNMAPEQAWSFFSSPYHLNEITPDFFHVEIVSPVPEELYPGLLIAYQMRAVFGWPMAWLSEVCHCEPPRRFVYQQRVGPFAFFSHEVAVMPCSGGVEVADIVFYSMRWAWLGECLLALLPNRAASAADLPAAGRGVAVSLAVAGRCFFRRLTFPGDKH